MRLLQTSELALPALRGVYRKTPVTRSYVPHLNFQAQDVTGPSAGRGRAGAVRT